MPLKDPKARRAYHQKYMHTRYRMDQKFRAQQLRNVQKSNRRMARKARILVGQFRSSGCLLCPEKSPCCMTAHHVDPWLKDFNVADALRGRISAIRIVRELLKCVCVCRNCHAKIHAGQISKSLLRRVMKHHATRNSESMEGAEV